MKTILVYSLALILGVSGYLGCGKPQENSVPNKYQKKEMLTEMISQYFPEDSVSRDFEFYARNIESLGDAVYKVIPYLLDLGFIESYKYLNPIVNSANLNNEDGIPYLWFDDDKCKAYGLFKLKSQKLYLKLDQEYYYANLLSKLELIKYDDHISNEEFGVWQFYLYYSLSSDQNINYTDDMDKLLFRLVSNKNIIKDRLDLVEMILRIDYPTSNALFIDLADYAFKNVNRNDNVYLNRLLENKSSQAVLANIDFASDFIKLYYLYKNNDGNMLFGLPYGGTFRSEAHKELYNNFQEGLALRSERL